MDAPMNDACNDELVKVMRGYMKVERRLAALSEEIGDLIRARDVAARRINFETGKITACSMGDADATLANAISSVGYALSQVKSAHCMDVKTCDDGGVPLPTDPDVTAASGGR